MAVLGLDLGTSAVKALLAPGGGGEPVVAAAPSPMDAPRPGWAEADPRAWLAAAGAATRAAVARGTGEPVVAIGLAGQMHGVVLARADAAPVRPALLWPDRRAAAVLDAWRALPAGARAGLGNPLVPGMAGPLLGWLAAHEPASLAAARWALAPKDWLRLALTGTAATEPSDASATLLWDLAADGWSGAAAACAGLDRALLAPLVASDAPAGALGQAGAAALGLPAGTPVHAGAADAAAALVGAAVTEPGGRLLNVGTGAQLATVVPDARTVAEPVTHRYRTASAAPAAGRWYAMAAVQNAGLALDWVSTRLGADRATAEGEAFVRDPGDPGDPLFVPSLTGERTPVLDPGARAAWIGLGLEHDRGALVRAAFEGVAHAVRLARDALAAEGRAGEGPLRLLGGGSLRPGYRQLLADVLGEPLELLAVADASARGAALLAGAPATAPVITATVQPRPAATRRLDERHARWRAAGAALRALGAG
jgi:xylulokinase